jgi:hypothetical protein
LDKRNDKTVLTKADKNFVYTELEPFKENNIDTLELLNKDIVSFKPKKI